MHDISVTKTSFAHMRCSVCGTVQGYPLPILLDIFENAWPRCCGEVMAISIQDHGIADRAKAIETVCEPAPR